jgi:hypothetical protein
MKLEIGMDSLGSKPRSSNKFLLQNAQTGSGPHPAPSSAGIRVLPLGQNGRVHLAPKLKSGAKPLLPQDDFMV